MNREAIHMGSSALINKAESYLAALCGFKPNRRTGSPGNQAAVRFVLDTLQPWGYVLDATPFPCLDFEAGKTTLTCGNACFSIHVSPFTLPCEATVKLVTASTVEELETLTCTNQILLMRGPLCAEQLMPKSFVFYNPDQHKRIYSILEVKNPAAIITATGRNPDVVGAIYPFPLIEDGDFDIPSAYCTDVVGEQIATMTGEVFRIATEARRIPSTACNVIARINPDAPKKVVVTAHIDGWGDTPGALDDASGIVVQLLLAEMLRDYHGPVGIELVDFNGEDYYSAPGQMDYLKRYGGDFDKITVVVNVDDVGYIKGKSAYSMYECPNGTQQRARTAFNGLEGMMEGEPWFQGDHMIFVQKGVPSIAVTSERMPELMATVTHTKRDTPDVVDCAKLVEVASAIRRLVGSFQD